MTRIQALFATAAVLALACGGDDGGNPMFTPSPDCTPTDGLTVSDLRLLEIGTGLSSPIYVTAPPGDGRLFILEQSGRIRVTNDDGTLAPEPYLTIDAVQSGGERGLLGLAFHPNWPSTLKFYTSYTRGSSPGESVIEEYQAESAAGQTALADSGRVIFTTAQDFGNHNGGAIHFGPDGYLYLGLGDGGSGGDPNNRGQTPDTLLGSMLRIDVDNQDAGLEYSIPADNPFADGRGGAPEVFAYGLRNPWRWSFDARTGDVYIADVGQNRIEEVNAVTLADLNGANFGWNTLEGSECFGADECERAGTVLPITEYYHPGAPVPEEQQVGNSITGGYVYRGACLPSIQGTYLYGDFATNVVRTLEWSAGGAARNQQDITESLGIGIGGLASFGQDGYGELYVVSYSGSIYRLVAP